MPTDGERICMADQRKKKPKKTKASLILFIVELVVLVVLVGAIFGYAKINEGLRNIGTADFGNAAAGNATVGNATAGNAAAANTVTANMGNIVADSASASVEGVMLANTSATGEAVVDELIEETVEDESVKKNSNSDEKASKSDKKASESDKKSSEADEETVKKKTSENAIATGSKTLKGETVTHVGTDEDPNADADAAEENEGISRNEKMKGYTNVVLVGIDTRDVDQIDYANSDTMIIASINNDTGNVRMVSVYRDTLLNVQDDYSMSLSQGDLDEEPASYAEAEVIGETTAHEEPAYDDEYEPIDDSYDEGGYDDGGYDDGGYDDGGYDDGGYDEGGDDGYDPIDEGGYDDGGYDDGGYDEGGDDGYDPVDEGGYDEGGNEGDYDDGGNEGGYDEGGDDGYDPVDEGGSTGDDGSHTDDGSTGGDAGNETVEETGDNGNASAEDDVAPVEEDEADPASEEDKESKEDKEDKEDTEDKEDNEDRNDAYIFEEPDDDVSEYADNEYYNYSETGTVATSQLGETTAAGRYDKANSAYANGSTKQLLQMLNKNMDLNIHDIIVVDFSSVAKLVDDLGGIDVWMTFEEVTHMNNYCQETSKVTGLDYTPIEPEEMPREYHLNGVQAVSYARIRYTAGNDMKRTQRQRVVIQKVVEKAKKNGLDAVQGMINDVLPMCKTSFSIAEIIKLARQAFSFDIEKTAGFPFEHIEKTVYVGSKALDAVVPVTLETNVQELHEFLFDDEDYECSATVKEYSNDISVLSGLTEASRDVAAKNSVIGESGGEADVVI